jgi:hypothetical protein
VCCMAVGGPAQLRESRLVLGALCSLAQRAQHQPAAPDCQPPPTTEHPPSQHSQHSQPAHHTTPHRSPVVRRPPRSQPQPCSSPWHLCGTRGGFEGEGGGGHTQAVNTPLARAASKGTGRRCSPDSCLSVCSVAKTLLILTQQHDVISS